MLGHLLDLQPQRKWLLDLYVWGDTYTYDLMYIIIIKVLSVYMMLSFTAITLRCVGPSFCDKPQQTKKLPATTTVSRLLNLCLLSVLFIMESESLLDYDLYHLSTLFFSSGSRLESWSFSVRPSSSWNPSGWSYISTKRFSPPEIAWLWTSRISYWFVWLIKYEVIENGYWFVLIFAGIPTSHAAWWWNGLVYRPRNRQWLCYSGGWRKLKKGTGIWGI